jgi:adenine-specific DNA-methyltransferase
MTELPERFDLASQDPLADRVAVLQTLFPEVFQEDKIDIDTLRRELGDPVEAGPERFGLAWPGKAECMRVIQEPSIGTLVPMRDKSVDFDTTQNVIIEGDNLEVLKLIQKAYYGKVKVIYIDPPYNTGKDFIYPDNFREGLADYLKYSEQVDDAGLKLSANAETDGRYHSKWLSMMYPRLFLGRNLLREDGFCVVSIDDGEVAHLRMLLDELFGPENFVATLVWDRNRKNDAKLFSVGHEYMLVYARNKAYLTQQNLVLRAPKPGVDEVRERFAELREQYGDDFVSIRRGLLDLYSSWDDEDDPRKPLARYTKVDERGPFRDDADISWPGGGGPRYDVFHPVTGKPCKVPRSGWRFPTPERMAEAVATGRVVFGADETTVPSQRSEMFTLDTQVMRSVQFSYAQTAANKFDELFDGVRVFDNPKHYLDLRQMVEYLSDADDLIVDFFAGSGSLGHGVLDASTDGKRRRYLMVQLPQPVDASEEAGRNAVGFGLETISDITRERMRRASMKIEAEHPTLGAEPLDLGFRAYKLVSSCFNVWDVNNADGNEIQERISLFTQHVVSDRSEEDVLNELLLKAGYPITASVQTLSLEGVLVHSVADSALLVCLGGALTIDVFEAMVARDPAMILVLDAGFGGNDELKVNALQTVRARNQRMGSDIVLRVV